MVELEGVAEDPTAGKTCHVHVSSIRPSIKPPELKPISNNSVRQIREAVVNLRHPRNTCNSAFRRLEVSTRAVEKCGALVDRSNMRRVTKSTRNTPSLPSTTFILDNGGSSLKAGFAPPNPTSDAAALPRCHVIPNVIVRSRDRKVYVGAQSEGITQWSEALFRRPVENGQVVGWEAQKEIWEQSFFDERTARTDLFLKTPEETTLVLAEAPNTMPALQKNADEIIMEEWGFGGYSRVVGRYGHCENFLRWRGDADKYERRLTQCLQRSASSLRGRVVHESQQRRDQSSYRVPASRR